MSSGPRMPESDSGDALQRHPDSSSPQRLDLEFEVVSVDEETGKFQIRARPDPRRYEATEIHGELHYVDRYSRYAIPLALVKQAMANAPLYHLAPRINSTEAYAAEREGAVRDELRGDSLRPPTVAPAKQQDPTPGRPVDLAIVSVDICSSTAKRREAPDAYDKASGILLRELMILVGQFNGSILKQTGDGFIAFIEHPSFTRQCDNAVDLGLSLLKTASALSPTLESSGLVQLSIRVGADFGQVSITNAEVAHTGYRWRSESGDALNLAVKIENAALPGTLLIGNALRSLLHVAWLQRTKRIEENRHPADLAGYPIYEVK